MIEVCAFQNSSIKVFLDDKLILSFKVSILAPHNCYIDSRRVGFLLGRDTLLPDQINIYFNFYKDLDSEEDIIRFSGVYDVSVSKNFSIEFLRHGDLYYRLN